MRSGRASGGREATVAAVAGTQPPHTAWAIHDALHRHDTTAYAHLLFVSKPPVEYSTVSNIHPCYLKTIRKIKKVVVSIQTNNKYQTEMYSDFMFMDAYAKQSQQRDGASFNTADARIRRRESST